MNGDTDHCRSLTEGDEERRKVDFEKDILDGINSIGAFQVRTLVWAVWVDVSVVMSILFFIFGGANPGFVCLTPDDALHNQSVVYSTDNHSTVNSSLLDTCSVNGTQCASRYYTGEYTSVITEWDLVCERRLYYVLINTSLMGGMFLGSLLCGQLADTYGRRALVFPLLAAALLAQLLLAFVSSWSLFMLGRFISGTLASGVLTTKFSLPVEVLSGRWRSLCVSVTGWPLASALLVFFAYFIRHWRHLAIACALSALPALAGFFVIPESPRWLIQKGRFSEAEDVLRRIAKVNGRPEPDYSLLPLICASSRRQQTHTQSYTMLDVFRTRQQIVHLCTMALFWFTMSCSYYGLSMNVSDLSGDIYINAALVPPMDLLAYLSVFIATQWLSRRRVSVAYMLVGAASLVIMLLTRFAAPSMTLTYFQTALSLFGRAAVSGAWCMAQLITAEIFPTPIRNMTYGGCMTAGNVGGLLAPYIAYLFYVHHTLPYLVFSVSTLITAICVVLFIPETRGRPLPELVPDWSDQSPACCRPRYKHPVSQNGSGAMNGNSV